jgi:hypothetical protein
MNKLFSELSIGEKFTISGSPLVYTKIQDLRVSCCKIYNVEEYANSNNKTYLAPGTVVKPDGQ